MLWEAPVNGEDPANGSWQIRFVNDEHTCLRKFQNHNVTAKWLAENYFSSFYVDPNFSHNSLKKAVHKDWGIHVSKTKCIRAKNLAIENLNGNYKEQYAKLYAYLDELRQSNPGTTTCKLDERKFERLYICIQAMKDGFKAGCRPIISLDGCHLKGYYQGHLLEAVGIDADDLIYPISFAVVESENQSSWCWFLELLATDLEIENSHSFTFMTDRQKLLASLRWWKNVSGFMWSFKPTFSISCIHAISVILSIEDRPEKYVDSCYSVSTQRAIYSHLISSVRGEQQWATNDTMEPILPPMFRRPPGRPHKKRKRKADEAPPMTGKVSKRGIKIFFKKYVEGVDIILEHARERLVPIRKDLDKHPVLLQQELLEFQNCQWMPTPGVPFSQENSASHLSQSPTPTPKPLSQDNFRSQSSPRIDP
ncbi:hypothetical protein V6N13_148936 [Hibiscus sabdariffa]